MLVITRKLNETVMIGDDIAVSVVRIDSGKVRLAIKAPREIPVDRAEIRFKDGYTPKKTK